MAGFDRLPLASFAGYEFPVREVTVKGSLRHHVHEYPHSPGGSTEELGRKLYEIKMTCPFHEGFAKWPQLWPEKLASLRIFFEGGQAWDLTIPTLGTISARCTTWEQRMNAKARSGEDCEFTFLENQKDAFLIQELITRSEDLPTLNLALQTAVPLRDVGRLGLSDPRIFANTIANENATFGRLFAAVDTINSIDGQAEQYGAIVAAKALNAIAICKEVDNLRSLKDPANWDIVHTMQDVQAELVKLTRDATGRSKVTRLYIVQQTASIAQVATRIYGDTSRAVELLKLNDLDDALSITPGTTIRYYEKAA